MEIVIVALVAVGFWLIWKANKANDTINKPVVEEVKSTVTDIQPVSVADVVIASEAPAEKPAKAKKTTAKKPAATKKATGKTKKTDTK